jgi:hypothetical protein
MNRVVMSVLDRILEVAEIDPEVVQPDSLLKRDFGVSSNQIREILFRSAKHLDIKLQLAGHLDDASPRQIVQILEASISSDWADSSRAA